MLDDNPLNRKQPSNNDAYVLTILAKFGNFPTPRSDFFLYYHLSKATSMQSVLFPCVFSAILETDVSARIVPQPLPFWRVLALVAGGGHGLVRCAAVGSYSRDETLATPRQTISLIKEPTIVSLKHG